MYLGMMKVLTLNQLSDMRLLTSSPDTHASLEQGEVQHLMLNTALTQVSTRLLLFLLTA